MMENEIELKPCPFCGGKAMLHSKDSPIGMSYIDCLECGVQIGGGNDAEALKLWNSRQEVMRETKEPKRWKEFFCLTPMVESDNMITVETLGRICEALGSEFMVCHDDRGGIGFGRLENKGEKQWVKNTNSLAKRKTGTVTPFAAYVR